MASIIGPYKLVPLPNSIFLLKDWELTMNHKKTFCTIKLTNFTWFCFSPFFANFVVEIYANVLTQTSYVDIYIYIYICKWYSLLNTNKVALKHSLKKKCHLSTFNLGSDYLGIGLKFNVESNKISFLMTDSKRLDTSYHNLQKIKF